MSAPALSVFVQGQSAVSADNLNTFVQSCDTIAQLRGFSGAQGLEVKIRGNMAANDGGAGSFMWQLGTSFVDDGFYTIVPYGVAGAWLRVFDSSNPANPLFYSYQQPANGFGITYPPNTGLLDLDPASGLAAGTIVMPAAPADGQVVNIVSSQAVTALTLSPGPGQSILNAATSLSPGAQISYFYRAPAKVWQRLNGAANAGSTTSSAVSAPQGRLTLVSGNPVMTTTIAGATTVFYTAYNGRNVPIWNGSAFVMIDTAGDLSQATNDTTLSPAAVAANSTYDLFIWLNGSTPKLSRGPAWASATVRSVPLVRIDGIWTNGGAITNGPALNLGTWVGTIQSNAASTIDFIFGSAASGGGLSSLNVWNAYNRVAVQSTVTDNGAQYIYYATTVRQARASANNQINFVVGAVEDEVSASIIQSVYLQTPGGSIANIGVGFNSAAGFTGSQSILYYRGCFTNAVNTYPALGPNFITSLESGDGTSSTNQFAVTPTAGPAFPGAALSAVLRM